MRINLPQPTFFFLLSSLFLFYIPHPNAAHLALTPAFVSLPTSYCFENSLDGSSDLPGTQFYFTSVPNLMGTKCVFWSPPCRTVSLLAFCVEYSPLTPSHSLSTLIQPTFCQRLSLQHETVCNKYSCNANT
jgi:hypothetical protein